VVFEEIHEVKDGETQKVRDLETDTEWEVVFSVICAKCEAELNEIVGF